MKTIKKASLLFASLALVLGAGLVGNSDTKEVKAEDATISAGDNASSAEVNLSDGTTASSSAMKAGTGKKQGTLKLSIPEGATKLSFYAVAWNGSSNATISITDDKSISTIETPTISINADSGISGNSPFTLSTSDVSSFLVTTNLSNVTADTTYTLKASVYRFVVWNATVEKGTQTSENTLSIVADKTSAKVEDEGQFSYTFKDPDGNDITAEDAEWSSSNSDVVMVEKDTGKWLAIGLGKATITLTVMDSDTKIYETSINFVVQAEPVISEASIADLMEKTKADNTVVSVKGKVSNIVNASYGNFDLVDLEDSSKSIYVYGATKDTTKLTLTDSGNGYYTGSWQSGQNFNNACAEGDIVTMNVVVTIYKNNPQIQGVITSVETPSQSIKLSADSLVIKKGETSQLTATLTGLTGNVSWSSDNTDVADVADDGTITAKAIGNAKITATLSGVTADCDIAVIENSGEDAENALTVEEAIYVAKTTSTATAKKYFIKGIVSSFADNTVDSYGQIKFRISDDGKDENTFTAWQVLYLDQQEFTSISQISIGDEVVLYGAVLNYNNTTPETDGKGSAYVYSHEKATDTLEKFLEDWNATIRNSEKGLCDFLSGDNKATLEALIKRYGALEDTADKAAATDSAGVKISESITYAQNVWNNSQTTEGNYGNSGVVITSNNSFDKTSLIALFAILGIVTISGYYIIEKKKFSK